MARYPNAQIGKNVHLSGGVGIGGVLEPLQAAPVIIEDDVFIGSRCIVVEGARVAPVPTMPTVLGERARDDVGRLHAAEASKGVLDTVHPGLHREGALHQMNRAAGLLEGTEEGHQVGLHTCAATIKKEEHVPLIDLPVSNGRCVKAATGNLQEFAQRVWAQRGQAAPRPRVRLPKR